MGAEEWEKRRQKRESGKMMAGKMMCFAPHQGWGVGERLSAIGVKR
jgi:hypothetical protein